jgi:hypothetical protein
VLAVVAVFLIACAGVVGALLHRRLFAGRDPESAASRVEGLPVSELVIPGRLVVALVLAFVLVQTFASYQDASDHAASEAGAVLAEAEAAHLLPPAVGARVAGTLRCYARSVAGPDWTAMDESREGARATDVVSRRVTESLVGAERASADPVAMTAVLSADEKRVEARRGRIAEAKPSVPGVVTALMIFGSVVVVASLAAFAHPAIRRGMRLALIIATAAIFAATLLVILDVDDPFGGIASVEPRAMRDTEHEIVEASFAGAPPCDTAGSPRPRDRA